MQDFTEEIVLELGGKGRTGNMGRQKGRGSQGERRVGVET